MEEQTKPLMVLVGMGPGMGLSLAHRFAKEGYRIAFMARRLDAVKTFTDRLRKEGIPAWGYGVDAADPATLQAAFRSIHGSLGEPDVLIYNASIFREALPSQLDPTDLDLEFRSMVSGFLVSAQAVIPSMKAKGRGSILLSGGGSALSPFASGASLCIGKSGQRSLCFSLAQELAPSGIHVATVTICGMIAPGTSFDPDHIADEYWQLHTQKREAFETERIYRG